MNTFSKLGTTGMLIDNDECYFVALRKNILVRYNLRDKKTEVLWKFEFNEITQNMFFTIKKIGDNLVLIPHGSDHIAIYNLKKKEMSFIEIEDNCTKHNEVYSETAKFLNTYIDKNLIYIFGYFYPAIIVLNTLNYSVRYLRGLVDEIDKEIKKDDDRGFFGEGFFRKGDNLYVPIACLNKLIIINLKDEKCIGTIDVKTPFSGIGGIECDGNKLWITGRGENANYIVCMDVDFNVLKTIKIEDNASAFDLFHKALSFNDRIVLLPISSKKAYEINPNSFEVKELGGFENLLNYKDDNYLWKVNVLAPYKRSKSVLTFITGKDFEWHDYYIETGERMNYLVELKKEDQIDLLDDIFNNTINNGEVLKEDKLPLEYFLQKI